MGVFRNKMWLSLQLLLASKGSPMDGLQKAPCPQQLWSAVLTIDIYKDGPHTFPLLLKPKYHRYELCHLEQACKMSHVQNRPTKSQYTNYNKISDICTL